MNLTKPINRNLPVPLTTSEKVEYGRSLAHLHADYGSLELDKKQTADRFKNDLEALDGRISYLAAVVRAGEEYRQVECVWRYMFETNVKELIRMDTGELVETAAITSEERQLMLQMENEMENEKEPTEAAKGN